MCDGDLVIDLSAMNGVRVDIEARTARAGGGCTLGDVDRETQAFGLAIPLGVVSLTGIAGLTLCGGLGWLRRKLGMACDALVSVNIVTADLFWAVRGGGGNFGVVTSFEYQIYPVGPTVTLCEWLPARGLTGRFMIRLEADGPGYLAVIRARQFCTGGMSEINYPFEALLITPAQAVRAGCCRRGHQSS